MGLFLNGNFNFEGINTPIEICQVTTANQAIFRKALGEIAFNEMAEENQLMFTYEQAKSLIEAFELYKVFEDGNCAEYNNVDMNSYLECYELSRRYESNINKIKAVLSANGFIFAS